ncbi:hypothetical protein [Nonomuraea sp. NPDC046570]|uniref:hypothetical protein n=1 Tax=Nonomuraea sp. NPDC046570 TaxID=3155255 RepID=UPI0033CB8C5B
MPFTAVEADVRAMVADPRWAALAAPAQARAVAARTLVTPDGGHWQFGAHARWYLQDPRDGNWHLASPPRRHPVSVVAHGSVLPLHLLPRSADLAGDRGSCQAFIGPDVPAELTDRVRELVRANGRRPVGDFPLTAFGEIFATDVPGTVAAVWATIMWCAYAPAFDGNERLLSVFGEYLGRPLPGDEWVRWLPAPPLAHLVALYADRIRAGQPRAALRIGALIADTAAVLAADARFRPRARALRAMLKPALHHPGLDDRAAHEGDDAVRRAWLSRVPERLSGAILAETDPAQHFRHRVYDLVEALSFTRDPVRTAAAFLATDVADDQEELARISTWLDHRLRHALHITRATPARPAVRIAGDDTGTGGFVENSGGFAVPAAGFAGPGTGGFAGPGTGGFGGPQAGEDTEPSGFAVPARGLDVEPPNRATAAAVLGAVYATGLAWCRLTGAEVPARGFPSSSVVVRWLIHERDDIPT